MAPGGDFTRYWAFEDPWSRSAARPSINFAGQAATASSPDQHFATSVPACISKSSPILDDHYGYDGRVLASPPRSAWADDGRMRDAIHDGRQMPDKAAPGISPAMTLTARTLGGGAA
jgi:hypothetical protein